MEWWYREGRVPLHTYAPMSITASPPAFTTFGTCGKVWIFRVKSSRARSDGPGQALAKGDSGRPSRRDAA